VSGWVEIGDRVFVRRYAFFDQNIVVVLDGPEALLVDTRSTHRQAAEIVEDLRALGGPRVAVVVNTHGHYDHAFGNHVFRPAVAWGHERSVVMLGRDGERRRRDAIAENPGLAVDLAAVQLDPPEHVFDVRATVAIGARAVELVHLGRGHTDNDIVVRVPDADVLCAGDLVENGAPPYFGDGFPMDWPATVAALLGLTGERTVVVPGHGDHAGRPFVASSLAAIEAIASLARRVHHGGLDIEAALEEAPYPAPHAREPLERALAQLRGELDAASDGGPGGR
jgi:glyoxylase-like metal-dependent hydrolase (beta-lactamase superfamily II)